MKVKRREGWQCTQCKGINYHLENCPEIQAGEPVRKEDGISKFQAIINSCREEGKKTTMKLYTGAEILVEANKQRGRVFKRKNFTPRKINIEGKLEFLNSKKAWEIETDSSYVIDIVTYNDWHFVDEEERQTDSPHKLLMTTANEIRRQVCILDLREENPNMWLDFARAISDYTYERVIRERK